MIQIYKALRDSIVSTTTRCTSIIDINLDSLEKLSETGNNHVQLIHLESASKLHPKLIKAQEEAAKRNGAKTSKK